MVEALSRREEDTWEFSCLYHAHRGTVRAAIYRISGADDLDDLVQEAFVRIARGLADFKGRSGIKTWIYRIAVNVALDHVRRRRIVSYDCAPRVTDPPDSDRSESVADRDLVARGLATLTVEHRAVLVLTAMEGLCVDEAAEVLRVPAGTVKSRLHYAKREMAAFLEREGVFK